MDLEVNYCGGIFHGVGHSLLTDDMDKFLIIGNNPGTIMVDYGDRVIFDGMCGRLWLLKYRFEVVGYLATNHSKCVEQVKFYSDAFSDKGGFYSRSMEKIEDKYVGSHIKYKSS